MLPSVIALIASAEPALAASSGNNSTLACAENARATVIAGLAERSPSTTLIIATATGTDAAQLHDDLTQFFGADEVLLYPAWEILPFERVSPNVETMGRRLEVLWRLQGSRRPRIVVAGIRAILQKLGPGARTLDPIVIHRGDQVDADTLLERLVNEGYRREELVEHRGEVSRRGSIIDIFPSTADTPVRIDLWGDEVDRLTSFNVNDQRSTEDLAEAVIFAARELRLDERTRERARDLVASEPWGREHWDRLSEGAVFDGMESWLPWLVDQDLLLTDLLDFSSRLVLIDPRRMRDRARDLLAEEDDLARALASTWARDAAKSFPRLHCEIDHLLAQSQSLRALSIVAPAEALDIPTVQSSGWGPITGDAEATARRIIQLVSKKWRVILAAEGIGSAARLTEVFREQGVAAIDCAQLSIDSPTDSIDMQLPGVYVIVAPLHRGCSLPACELAIIS